MNNDLRSLNSLEDIEFAVKRIEELEAKLAKAMEDLSYAASRAEWAARALTAEAKLENAIFALDEAIYLLDPDDEDIAKETGLHRIVTIRAELKGESDE